MVIIAYITINVNCRFATRVFCMSSFCSVYVLQFLGNICCLCRLFPEMGPYIDENKFVFLD